MAKKGGAKKSAATSKANSAAASTSGAPSAAAGGSALGRVLLLSFVALLAAVAYQRWSAVPGETADEPLAGAAAPSPLPADADDVENVRLAFNFTHDGALEPIEQTIPVDEPEDPAIERYALHIERVLREYTDEREPVAFEQSDDGEVQRVDRIALLLQDHSALVEFLHFPHAPVNLETSPTLSAMSVDDRRAALQQLFAFVLEALRNEYYRHVKMSEGFRDSVWALVGDFEDEVGSEPQQYVHLSLMEREILAKTLSPDSKLFDTMEHAQRNFMFWDNAFTQKYMPVPTKF